MKQYIVTFHTTIGDREATVYAESLASVAIMLENGRLPLKAVEEIPADVKANLPFLDQIIHEIERV